VCLDCGHVHPIVPAASSPPSERRLLPALLLCLVIGLFGAHRFYAGRTASGILQLLTVGGFGIWWLADLILLATGQFRDAQGARITEWS
jgi:TM2 domain-containing membrane protein YozV